MLTFLLAIAAIDSMAALVLMIMNYKLKKARQSLGWIDADYMPKQYDN